MIKIFIKLNLIQNFYKLNQIFNLSLNLFPTPSYKQNLLLHKIIVLI